MNELETTGFNVLKSMGLEVFGDLGHVQVKEAIPNSPYGPDYHFEFDYFIVYNNTCIVGEMSGKSNENIRDKYDTFIKNFGMLSSAKDNSVFDSFSISREKRYLFHDVVQFKAFFIAHEFERFDVKLVETEGVSVIFRGEWETLSSYANIMGAYAKFPFLKIVNVAIDKNVDKKLTFNMERHNLMRLPNKWIAAKVDEPAEVFTFISSPGDLLGVAEVFRRELMPVIAVNSKEQYQRPLDLNKVRSMKNLVSDPGFMFPNSILLALSEDCSFNNNELLIPMRYGAASVIDGQHRLFSYAHCDILDSVRRDAKVAVIAFRFNTQDRNITLRCSAKTFIQINQMQTRISSDHINEIAYSVLGEEHPKALAAQVILQTNQRYDKPLHGLFKSSQTTKGVYHAATIITYLSSITNTSKVSRISQLKTSKHKDGYNNLFGLDTNELINAEKMIERGVICLERYTFALRKVFTADWPERNNSKDTTLVYTKVFTAFIQLLSRFIKDGLNWKQVNEELTAIRKNILSMRGLDADFNGIVFPKGNPDIPDDQPSVGETYRFLHSNRSTPTSMLVVKKRA